MPCCLTKLHATQLHITASQEFFKWLQIAKKNDPPKHDSFIIFVLQTVVKVETKSGLGKARGTTSHFLDPRRNNIKAYQKACASSVANLDSFRQIIVKSKQICNKNTNLGNARWNEILSKPYETSMACGIHLFANAFPKPFGYQLCPKT